MTSETAAFVDTSVLVDLGRLHPPALEWMKGRYALGVTVITWLEMIRGTRDRHHQREVLRLLKQFDMCFLMQQDMEWALVQFPRFHLSHKVGIRDCLIASVVWRLQVPLYTHNLKHMHPLLGDFVMEPY